MFCPQCGTKAPADTFLSGLRPVVAHGGSRCIRPDDRFKGAEVETSQMGVGHRCVLRLLGWLDASLVCHGVVWNGTVEFCAAGVLRQSRRSRLCEQLRHGPALGSFACVRYCSFACVEERSTYLPRLSPLTARGASLALHRDGEAPRGQGATTENTGSI